jgi:hypothetical protein
MLIKALEDQALSGCRMGSDQAEACLKKVNVCEIASKRFSRTIQEGCLRNQAAVAGPDGRYQRRGLIELRLLAARATDRPPDDKRTAVTVKRIELPCKLTPS